MQILRDFKAFVVRGNVVDLAVGIVVGSAFTAVVSAFVADILTPLISIPGKANFASMAIRVHHSVFYYGRFLNALISFVLVATAVFFGVVKPLNGVMTRLRTKQGQTLTSKICPFCMNSIPLGATRCGYCTSQLQAPDSERNVDVAAGLQSHVPSEMKSSARSDSKSPVPEESKTKDH